MTEKSAKDGIKPVIITADSRESRSGIALKLQNLPGVSLEQAELTSGDYLLGPGVAVERKAANDFVISLMEGRLFVGARRLAIGGESLGGRRSEAYLRAAPRRQPGIPGGALSYISLLSGASLIHSPSLARTPYILHRMALHDQHGCRLRAAAGGRQPKGPAAAQYILEGLPSVGPKLAGAAALRFAARRRLPQPERSCCR